MFNFRKFDPGLERLREEVLKTTNVKTVLLPLQKSAEQIHASCLFENEGIELLQKLCLFISGTASNKSYGDWQKFAACLGLSTEQIRVSAKLYDYKLSFINNLLLKQDFLSLIFTVH